MTWLYCSAILLGSCLLFLVQPMCAKMLLPLLGGTPAVWNTCMVFFQTGLLVGYAYAHVLPRRLGVGRHAILHLMALIGAYFMLPIRLPDEVHEGWHPVLWLLASLTISAGVPFVLLAAGAPLLQRWFVRRHQLSPRDPYFLYAASNLGSFLALALFPFVLEPYFSLSEQSDVWRFAFLALTALMAFCAPLSLRAGSVSDGQAATVANASGSYDAPTWRQRGRWIVLALIPSSLLLSVTAHLTTDVAAMPLLWLIPMALYLLTFTIVFAQKNLVSPILLQRWLPLAVIVVLIVMLSEATEPLLVVMFVHLAGFFYLALVCHSELAHTRPTASHLTDFYLCLALGGVLGGALNALVAPLVFSSFVEYPLMIVLACVFALERGTQPTRADWLWAAGIGAATAGVILAFQSPFFVKADLGNNSFVFTIGLPLLACYVLQRQPARFALCIGAVLCAGSLLHGAHGTTILRERSYFGIHRVTEIGGLRRLIHGNTVHGQQSLDPEKRREPLTYYSRIGPIGEVFRTLKGDPRLGKVGVVGLGTGSLAAYAEPGQAWTFFEIDPSVQHIAEDPKLFTFLSDARERIGGGKIDIDLGDARLQLKKSDAKFGVLVVDAFGSDAIPVHLLTREAFALYLDRLEPNGILAFHISNRYVDLEPVLANLAAEKECIAYVRQHRGLSKEEDAEGIMLSDWVVIARRPDDLAALLNTGHWRPGVGRPGQRVWTDDFSNLLQVFRWRLVE